MRLDSHSGVMKVREALQERGFPASFPNPSRWLTPPT